MNNTQLGASVKTPTSRPLPMGEREFKVASRPVVSYSGAQQNELLAALPREVLEALFEHLELVQLPFGKELFEYGSKLENVYFPTTAIVSLLYVMEDGATTEIAVVGHEGVVGVSMFEGERAMCGGVVQSAGYGYRLKAQHLREAFNQGGALPQLLMRYNTALFAQMAQNAVGGRHSSIEQKLCRWLLDRLDRSASNELKVTQEMISIMLGVRRESITAAAGKLQEEGMITYRRGNITVLDRAGLERYAGECYKVAKTEYDRLLVDVARC
ncbi:MULTISPECIES: Crp/Fnr family transcriptional regulator [Telluria group]|uniref:CRP-like cAMP-binding protein n=1 Tax=Pseudoduganella violacea TaxID=1715466 RepID=A0A7W5BD17_9BURK|nr:MULTISPECIES: Crp/Fnr family transcriptional regulator [Telluria group]MBB3120879.1 CRP-like cAMP-binding protein [Pseudoduganella violacea]NVD99539.1 Crp/Fnr family transcriptional regulator [Massilia sp. BJB1822]